MPLAALLVFGLERRWLAMRDITIGGLLGLVLTCGWAFVTSGDEIVRQSVLLQALRPADPAAGRWAFVLSDASMAFTALAALGGAAGLCTLAWQRRVASGWLLVCLWVMLTLALFAHGSSFYDHYYAKLALPLALLAAALPDLLRDIRWRWAIGSVCAVILGPLWWGEASTWTSAEQSPQQRAEVRRIEALPAHANVLNLMPLENMLTGRSFAHPAGGPYILDTFLGTIYLDSPLNRRWTDAATTMRAAINAADYVVTDPWTAPLPGLRESFAEQPLLPGSSALLFTRVDQPATVLQVGPDLQLMQRLTGRLETIDGQTWLIQPLHWRASATPAPDQALSLKVYDRSGAMIGQLDVPINGGTTWKPGRITTLEYRVPLKVALSLGTYIVKATTYSWTDGAPIPMQPVTGSATTELELPSVEYPTQPNRE